LVQESRDQFHKPLKISPYKLAPAGAPITLPAIREGVRALFKQRDALEEFQEDIRSYLNVKHSFLISSGRAALFIILKILQKGMKKKEVIVPGYTCFTVGASIARAGLRILPCDLSVETFGFDLKSLKQMKCDNVLCILPTHLFGLPANLADIRKLFQGEGIAVIEDAAQAFGGESNGKKLGTLGDVGFFSLQRGKNITTMEGGIIVTNSEWYGKEISEEVSKLPSQNASEIYSTFLTVLIYWLFLEPALYWIPDRLPFVKLGVTDFRMDFSVKALSYFQAGVGRTVLSKLDEYNQIRILNTDYLYKNIPQSQAYIIPHSIDGSLPPLIRFPIVFKDLKLRDKIHESLQRHGIGSSKMYPLAIGEVPEASSYLSGYSYPLPSSRTIAGGILTLPTHPLVTQKDLELIVNIFSSR
jgi:dTDP-4-amino-4,6-dideoxygalactose transaminase